LKQIESLINAEEVKCDWVQGKQLFYILPKGSVAYNDERYLKEGQAAFWKPVTTIAIPIISVVISITTLLISISNVRNTKNEIEQLKSKLQQVKNSQHRVGGSK
jgi:hypothetical protein